MKDNHNKQKSETQGKDQRDSKPHVLEWVIGGLSAALVLTMIGYILYQAVGTVAAPKPDLEVVVEQIE